MRISDWSSDVVSSDLFVVAILEPLPGVPQHVVQTKCVGRKRTYWRRVLPAVGVFGQWSVRAPVDTGVRVVMDVLITPIERRGRPGPCGVLPFSLCQIGRAHVCTPVTNAHIVCRLLHKTKTKQ